MVFDISYGEFAVIGVAAFTVLGRKQMVAGAFVLGKGLGRSSGLINRGRDAVEKVVSSQELKGVNSELGESFRQFSNVQRELQSIRVDPMETVKYAVLSNSSNQLEKNGNTQTATSQLQHGITQLGKFTNLEGPSVGREYEEKGGEFSGPKAARRYVSKQQQKSAPASSSIPSGGSGVDIVADAIEEMRLLSKLK